MFSRITRMPTAQKWFWVAGGLLTTFLIFTAVLATGVLTTATLHVEQWLMQRPLTGADCVLHVWAKVGEGPFSLLLTVSLGLLCLRLGYRPRVLFYLLLLLALSVGIELAGKQLIPQPIPQGLDGGMSAMQCPQIDNQPTSAKVLMLAGAWWTAPAPAQQDILDERQGATTHFNLATQPPDYYDYSYPSGHAIRWSFLGAILCWLLWRHRKPRSLTALRILLMTVALAFAFGGGLAQFYIGAHLATDTVAGYLIGFSFAAWIIGLLTRNRKSKEDGQTHPVPEKTGALRDLPQGACFFGYRV